MKTRGFILTLAALVAASSPALAQHEGHGAMGDSAAVAAVVAKYHDALARGDSAAALALLADDAVILESGGVETRAEYRSHHLPGDINFAKAVPSKRGGVHVKVHGDVAWTTATNTTQGDMNGRAVNSSGAELMVLVRTPAGWKISAIHWSSRNRRTP
jgi:ketosteroid isomerase-like protein